MRTTAWESTLACWSLTRAAFSGPGLVPQPSEDTRKPEGSGHSGGLPPPPAHRLYTSLSKPQSPRTGGNLSFAAKGI